MAGRPDANKWAPLKTTAEPADEAKASLKSSFTRSKLRFSDRLSLRRAVGGADFWLPRYVFRGAQWYLLVMTTKQGRPRRFDFGVPGDASGQELSFLLGFLDELVVRVEDQVVHLPASALNFTGPNSTLSIGRLILHLISADLTMLGKAVPGVAEPEYQARLGKVSAQDFASEPGDLWFAPEILTAHAAFRRTHFLAQCRGTDFLDRTVDHIACRTNRELLAHVAWHWSYHSGQIGLIAMEAGFDYVWVSTLRS